MPDLQSTEMSPIVPAEGKILDSILDGTHDIWSEGLLRSFYGQLWRAQRATPWGRMHLTRWALVDGADVCASAKIYDFDAVLDGRAVRIAGIGAVFTPPASRGRGHAHALIEGLLDRASRDGV